MSQTATDATDDGTDNSQPPADSLTEQVTAMRERLDALESDDVADMDDVDLVELRDEIKTLESQVEDARKDIVDDELEGRIDVGDSLYGLKRIQSHNKYLVEDPGTVIMRAVNQGIDYTSFVQVNASTLAKEQPDLAEIGEATYTYLR